MQALKPHEFTTQVMIIKGPYHRLNHVPDRLFLIANGIVPTVEKLDVIVEYLKQD